MFSIESLEGRLFLSLTQVSGSGSEFFINGTVTHANSPLKGTLPNSRMANAIFDATGVRLRRVPFRNARVLAALKTARV